MHYKIFLEGTEWSCGDGCCSGVKWSVSIYTESGYRIHTYNDEIKTWCETDILDWLKDNIEKSDTFDIHEDIEYE